MILSAQEFVRLRQSDKPEEYNRAASEEISEAVCFEVIEKYPDMKAWVAHNKKVPLSVLKHLADVPDPWVRVSVGEKRKQENFLYSRRHKAA